MHQKLPSLRREREDSGYGDMYSVLQSVAVPKIDDSFIGKRVDVLFAFEILDSDANKQELRWCQGEVTKIITGTKKPTVEVRYDAIPELKIDVHTSIQNSAGKHPGVNIKFAFDNSALNKNLCQLINCI